VSRRVSFTSGARRELFEAADFYNGGRPGLGAEFLTIVEQALTQLTEYPESAPVVRGRVRSKALRRFPYSLVYTVREDGLRILAVMNQKRQPFYWWGRQ
jgi:hypothetical protein